MKFTTGQLHSFYINQLFHLQQTFADILKNYEPLVHKRIFTELSRDELFAYELVDILLHLVAILEEANKEEIYPDYMIKKINLILSNAQIFKKHFEIRKDDNNESN